MAKQHAGSIAICCSILISTGCVLLYLSHWHAEYEEKSALQLANIEGQSRERFANSIVRGHDGSVFFLNPFLDWSVAMHAYRLRMQEEGRPMTDAEFKATAQKPFLETKTNFPAIPNTIDLPLP
jgi:hypothetical protein